MTPNLYVADMLNLRTYEEQTKKPLWTQMTSVSPRGNHFHEVFIRVVSYVVCLNLESNSLILKINKQINGCNGAPPIELLYVILLLSNLLQLFWTHHRHVFWKPFSLVTACFILQSSDFQTLSAQGAPEDKLYSHLCLHNLSSLWQCLFLLPNGK